MNLTLSRLWDRLSIYLPVLLMMFLALGTYWLLRATPEVQAPAPVRAATHEPDYFMKHFSVKVFDPDGSLKSEVYGAEARHHPDNDSFVIDAARIRSFTLQRQLTVAAAKQITSNATNTQFVLEGEASVVRQAGRGASGERLPRLEFHGELLRVSTEPERVTSERPVLLVRDKDQITADRLDYRGDRRVAVLVGNVRAQFAAR